MKYALVKIFVITLIFLGTNNVFSSPLLTGEITELWVNDLGNSNIIFVSIGQNFDSACPIGTSRYLVMDLDDPGMREAYAMALAAFMGGKQISMAGAGQCIAGQGIEKLRYIYMLK